MLTTNGRKGPPQHDINRQPFLHFENGEVLSLKAHVGEQVKLGMEVFQVFLVLFVTI